MWEINNLFKVLWDRRSNPAGDFRNFTFPTIFETVWSNIAELKNSKTVKVY